MSVIAFKQKPATQETRIQETKRLAKQAVRKRRRAPLLFHNGSERRPVRLFYARPRNPNLLTQADIDTIPDGHVPMYSDQLFVKMLYGQIKIRSRLARFFRKMERL